MLTVPEVARMLSRPDWLIRRTVDLLDVAVRIGQYRGIPEDTLDTIRKELERRDERIANRKAKG